MTVTKQIFAVEAARFFQQEYPGQLFHKDQDCFGLFFYSDLCLNHPSPWKICISSEDLSALTTIANLVFSPQKWGPPIKPRIMPGAAGTSSWRMPGTHSHSSKDKILWKTENQVCNYEEKPAAHLKQEETIPSICGEPQTGWDSKPHFTSFYVP